MLISDDGGATRVDRRRFVCSGVLGVENIIYRGKLSQMLSLFHFFL